MRLRQGEWIGGRRERKPGQGGGGGSLGKGEGAEGDLVDGEGGLKRKGRWGNSFRMMYDEGCVASGSLNGGRYSRGENKGARYRRFRVTEYNKQGCIINEFALSWS